MTVTELLTLYAILVPVSALFSPEQIVVLLERDGSDTAHCPWAYLLLWGVFAFSLTGLIVHVVKKSSKP